ncbi:TLC domain-domain-containing protein [Naematelia encephala]|uniref:TLC domain-domain-containing protein n=1 Tax=Naematelia encephala TaxID=71784 RepID=A0A1Y2AKC4_9TREE|nr:TLC domain-domain-containing protein [Naematelia encephala]
MQRNMTQLPTLTHLQSRLPTSLLQFVSLQYPVPPTTSSRLASIFSSSHSSSLSSPPPTLYSNGPRDVYFVFSCAVAFTVLREVIIRGIVTPSARYWLVKDRASKREKRKLHHIITRFAEQSWSFFYCSIFWSIGVTIVRRVPGFTTPEQLWGTYPVLYLPALTKFYYLAQLGWWFHQIFVIHTEKPRSDHWQMLGHHILTITLIVSSYRANFTRVGTLIHVLMDFCDIVLPLAKMLRYLSLSTACDATFVLFLVSWLFSRQVGLFLVIKTSYFDAPKFIPFEWNPSAGRYLTHTTYRIFIAMQVVLYCLATAWFYLACMVAVRVVRGLGADDSRSDAEDEGIDGEESPLEDVPTTTTSGHHIIPSETPTPNGQDGELRKRK